MKFLNRRRFLRPALGVLLLASLFYSQAARADDDRRRSSCADGLVQASNQFSPKTDPTFSADDKTVFVVDTNALYSDPELLGRLQGYHVVLPMAVIEELDKHKNENNERSQTARYVSKRIKALADQMPRGASTLNFSSGGSFSFFEATEDFDYPPGFDRKINDDRIAMVAHQLALANPEFKITVMTGDMNLSIKSSRLGIPTVDGKIEIAQTVVNEVLSAPLELALDFDQLESIAAQRSLSLESLYDLGLSKNIKPSINHFIIFKRIDENEDFSLDKSFKRIWRFKSGRNDQIYAYPVNASAIKRLIIKPMNDEQVMALDLLLDRDIELITMAGIAGTGKTLITLAAALQQSILFSESPQAFKKIMFVRSPEPVGKDIGFLPGSAEEKSRPWIQPAIDNLTLLVEIFKEQHDRHIPRNLENGIKKDSGEKSITSAEDLRNPKKTPSEIVEQLVGSPFFPIKPIATSRGSTWHQTFVIVDEGQNLTKHQIKTLVSRAGEGTKFVILGDIEQIDNRELNFTNNGLVIVGAKFQNQSNAAHIVLTKGERSRLASQAAELLR